MLFQYSAALLFLGTSASAHVLGRSVPQRCAIPEPTELQKEHTKALFEIEKAQAREGKFTIAAAISVDVYVHVVSSAASKYITVCTSQLLYVAHTNTISSRPRRLLTRSIT